MDLGYEYSQIERFNNGNDNHRVITTLAEEQLPQASTNFSLQYMWSYIYRSR